MNEMPEGEKLLTFKEACQYLRIGRTTLYRFIDDGRVEGHRVGRLWRFYLEDLRSFVVSKDMRKRVNEVGNIGEQG